VAWGEFEEARDEVGREVGVDDADDRQFMPPRIGDVLVHVAARVDHDRRAGGLVSDEIRGLGKAVEVVLHKTHPSSRAFASDDLSVLRLVRVPDYGPKT